MLRRLKDIASYNRDWPIYVKDRFFPPKPRSTLTFRLRNGQEIELPAVNRFLLNEIYLDKVYDIEAVDYRQCLNVLDVGGNVGIYALYVTSQNLSVRVFSFEPSSSNLAILRRNLERNPRQAGQITVIPKGIAARTSSRHLSLKSSPAEYSLVADRSATTEQVDCVDLESALAMTGVAEFDILKMDIEGAEAEILEVATNSQLRRFKAMMIEWHDSLEALEPLVERVRNAGFVAEGILIERARFLRAYRVDHPDLEQ